MAETFTFADEEGRSLNDLARLDTMVTMVDVFNFLRDFGSSDSLVDRRQARDEQDDRCVVDLLVDQIEFADVIVLNKTDLVGDEDLKRVTAIIKGLNPEAELVYLGWKSATRSSARYWEIQYGTSAGGARLAKGTSWRAYAGDRGIWY